MAQTFKRVCIETYTISDAEGTTFTIHRGREYLTSPEVDGQIRVLSQYWVWVPASIFAGAVEYTPAPKVCPTCGK